VSGERSLVGRLLLSGELVPGRLSIADGRIRTIEVGGEIELGGAAAPGSLPTIAPGLVDLHVHGFGGCDPLDDLAGMARALARAGTTAFQPTLFPGEPAGLGRDAERVSRAAEASNAAGASGGGALSVGLHLEGPFLNPVRAGAIPREALALPSPAALRAILGAASGAGRGVRTMTLAPELAGAGELIAELARSDVRVSLGHSDATAAEARAASRRGAAGATHLFNAMSGVHHRAMGLAGFALSDAALTAELIGDLAHVGPEAIDLALAARGPQGLALVSDALPGAGTGCRVFHWHGREHEIDAGAAWFRPRAEDGQPGRRALAGSASSQLEMVRRLVERAIVSLPEALTMAAETPARALGLEHELGRLAPGARADLVILDEALELVDVWIGGESIAAS
jgi:N-acetylglucosamine-6-phosphate deacetylase